MTTKNTLPNHLILAQKQVYTPLNLDVTNIEKEVESAEYEAFTFKINSLYVIYREAKITPTKIGQFVTLWKRKTGQPIEPFHASDTIDFVIVSTRNGAQLGEFIFPKSILIEKGIISTETKEGKRAFRVYPPWDKAENKQAQASQKWQLNYFLTVFEDEKTDLARAKKLFGF
jgi:hypothetical protein